MKMEICEFEMETDQIDRQAPSWASAVAALDAQAGANVNHRTKNGRPLGCCIALVCLPCMLSGSLPCFPYGLSALDMADQTAIRDLLRQNGGRTSLSLLCGLSSSQPDDQVSSRITAQTETQRSVEVSGLSMQRL